MTVVGIIGSPHPFGNTGLLVRNVLSGAEEKGHKTKIFCLNELEIKPLSAGSIKPYDVSFPNDDMTKILPYLEKMSALVLGTPIYYDHISASTKLLIDRLYYYETSGKTQILPKNIPAVIIVTYEWDDPNAYDEVANWMRGRLEHYWKMKVVVILKAEGTMKKPVPQRTEILERAREIGRNL